MSKRFCVKSQNGAWSFYLVLVHTTEDVPQAFCLLSAHLSMPLTSSHARGFIWQATWCDASTAQYQLESSTGKNPETFWHKLAYPGFGSRCLPMPWMLFFDCSMEYSAFQLRIQWDCLEVTSQGRQSGKEPKANANYTIWYIICCGTFPRESWTDRALMTG